jgi:RimK family alpha-L-glutamate ligase
VRIAILASSRGWHVEALRRAIEAKGHEATFLPITALCAQIPGPPHVEVGLDRLEAFDGILVRTLPRGSLEQVVFRMDVLHRLENLGCCVVNRAKAIERCADKFLTSALLRDAGLVVPPTVVTERADAALEAYRRMGDCVVKPLFGSEGRGMVRITDEETAYRVFCALELARAVYYVQATIPHHGFDVRVLTVGGRVVGAMRRWAQGWRTNLAQGGHPEPLQLPREWAEMALRATEAVGAEVAGVDLLPGRDGRVYVLEVNAIPGWRGLAQVTGLDIAACIVDHMVRRIT